jgi:asparagine synthase (glutamine-hydrolysing)
MSYRYIALASFESQRRDGDTQSIALILHDLGLQRRFSSPAISVFTSADTPVASLPGGGILIGYLFSQDGIPYTGRPQSSGCSSAEEMQRYFLENCWGEYVLVQSPSEDEQSLMVTRDPSGGVPCVYAVGESSGFITSDISLATSLSLYHRQIDWDFIAQCLTYPHIKSGRTGLIGVKELLPGSSLQLRGAKVATEAAWSPWNFVCTDVRQKDVQTAAAAIREAVSTVVRTWASTDESILLELSGGIDSSIVGTCLRETPARVVCCTLVTAVPGADERQYAQLIADYLHTELCVEELPFERAQFEFALPDDSVTPRIGPLQHAIDQTMADAGERYGVKSFFSGGGGDTVFCFLKGAAPAADAFREFGLAAGITAIRDLSELHQCTFWKAGRLTLRKLLRSPKTLPKANSTFVASKTAPEPPQHPWFDVKSDALPGDRERIFDLAGTQIFMDAVPRRSKRRLRMPLLSQPVMEACLRAPSWMWIAEGRNRAVARLAFADRLPRAILSRRSKGTFMGYLGSAYRRSKNQMEDFLLGGQLEAHDLLDTGELRRYFASDHPSDARVFTRIFDLCMIENWARHQA